MDAPKISRAMWLLLVMGCVNCAQADSEATARQHMLAEIQRDAGLTGPLFGAAPRAFSR